jgi:type III pantothenate kinase
MLLVIDVGNTHTVFAVFEGDRLRNQWRAQTHRQRTADEYAALLDAWLTQAGLGAQGWEAIAMCSVVPPVDAAIELLAERTFRCPVFPVHYRLDLGLQMKVATPELVGADRLANAAYAVRHLKLPAAVVDCGTATKIEVVSAKREYLGGVILPGLRLSMEALSLGTAKLPVIDLRLPASVIGRTTVECLQAGILYGHIETIEGLLRRIEQELGSPCDSVLTGGLSSSIAGGFTRRLPVLPDLTLESVAAIYRSHKPQRS